jgi:ABC-type amino acid transport substrate-binding protein
MRLTHEVAAAFHTAPGREAAAFTDWKCREVAPAREAQPKVFPRGSRELGEGRSNACSRRAFLQVAARMGLAVGAGAFAAGSGLALTGCTNNAQASAEEETLYGATSVRVGADLTYPPYEWLCEDADCGGIPVDNKEGSYALGFDILLLQKLAAYFGVEIVLVNLPHEKLIEYLGTGLVDLVVSAYGKSAAREESCWFSDGYASYGAAVAARKGSAFATAATVEDLAGARIVCKRDFIFEEVAAQIPGLDILEPVDTMAQTYFAVIDGEADIALVDRAGFDLRDDNWQSLALAPIAASELPVPGDGAMHIAIRNDEEGWVDEVNAFVATLNDETIATMWRKTAYLEAAYGVAGEKARTA